MLRALHSIDGSELSMGLPRVLPGADPGVRAVCPQAIGCITFRHACGYLPSRRASPAGTKLYCLVTEAHGCEQLAKKVVTPQLGGRGSNSRPLSHQSDALATRLSIHPNQSTTYTPSNRARQLYKNISMLFLFPVKDGKLSTGVNATFNASCYG